MMKVVRVDDETLRFETNLNEGQIIFDLIERAQKTAVANKKEEWAYYLYAMMMDMTVPYVEDLRV